MNGDKIMEFYDEVIKAAECYVKGLEELSKAVLDAIDKVISTSDIGREIEKIIEKIISSVEKQDVKYDKNISHFKYISDRNYDNPYYRIEPKARTHCR